MEYYMFHPLHTPFVLILWSFVLMLRSFVLIMTFMYICKEFTEKSALFNVSSITHPFHAESFVLNWFANWALYSIPKLLWLSLIMTFMYSCKEFTGKNLFRIIILIWKLHVSSITHPFRADVTIICVDLIWYNWTLYSIPILIKFAMIITDHDIYV